MSFKKVFRFLISAGLVLIVALVVLWQFLPLFLETAILPGLAVENGIGWQHGRIRRIGLTGFEAGPVVIGGKDAVGITVDTVRADYTPWGLFQKRIQTVTVSGLRLNLAVTDGDVAIHGIDMKRLIPAADKKAVQDEPRSAVIVRRIRINHAEVNVDQGSRHLSIPIDLAARLTPAGDIDAMLNVYPCGQKVQIAGNWSLAESSGNVALTARSLSLGRMAAVFEVMPNWAVEGEVDLEAQAAVHMSPWAYSGLALSVSSASLSAVAGDIGLAAGPVTGLTKTPLTFTLRQTGPQRFTVAAAGLVAKTRVPLVLDDLKGDLSYGVQALKAQARVLTRLPAVKEDSGLPLAVTEDLVLASDISLRYALAGDWQVTLTDAPGSTGLEVLVVRDAGDIRVVAKEPVYDVRLKGVRSTAGGTFSVAAAGIQAEAPSLTVNALKTRLQGSIAVDNSGQAILPRGSIVLQISDVRAGLGGTGEAVELSIPGIQVRAETDDRGSSDQAYKKPGYSGDLLVSTATLDVPTSQVRLAGIEARVPWQWPPGKGIARGLLAVGSIQWQDQDMGSLGMAVKQHSQGISFQGEHISTLLPALQLGLSGDLIFPAADGIRAEVAASLSRPATAPEIDLGQIFKGGRGIYLKGDLSGELKGGLSARGMEGTACARLVDAAIRMPDKDVAVKNLNAGICFPELPQLTTGPSQVLTFEDATAGNFMLEGGAFHFQLEPFQTLFVEKGRVGWCGGNIRLQSLRITPGVDAYETRLDCDRLNLARILEQLSVADASGEGAVNGTLPIFIDKGTLRFDDGFLYSTPGDGGKIRLSGADALMAGIPKGTRQFFQIDLAREALKDFDYKWAKLRVVSEGENLRMRLQFDGKPGRILPFEYDESFGGFVRVDADSRGSEFEGISLDVNFTVPLNDLLEYKDVLNLLE